MRAGLQMSKLPIITEGIMARPAIHPGEILAEELAEVAVSPTELARQLRVPANRITQIVQGKGAITGDTALRLGHWFGTSAQFWLNLQSAYDIRVRKDRQARRSGGCRNAHSAHAPRRSRGMLPASSKSTTCMRKCCSFPPSPR